MARTRTAVSALKRPRLVKIRETEAGEIPALLAMSFMVTFIFYIIN